MSTYEPGTVAVATVRGVPNVRVMRATTNGQAPIWFTPETTQVLDHWHSDRHVTDVRPLVVLDLNEWDGESVTRHLRNMGSGCVCSAIADQIEAQTKPPRIPEPGWGAIVEAHSLGAKGDRLRWVRGDKGWTNLDATGEYLNWVTWEILVDPVLVRDGIEGAS